MNNNLTIITDERLDTLDAKAEASQVAKIVARAKSEIEKAQKGDGLTFPIDTFPKPIRDILINFQQCSGLPMEYYFGYLLGAVSGLIGNRYKIKFKSNYLQSPMLYMAVVGPPSVGKTPVMNDIFREVYEIENEFQLQHKLRIDKWKKEKEELAAEGEKHRLKELEDQKPAAKELLIEDTTIEYIASAMAANPNGLILLRDEMAAWIKSFDAYKSGGAETQAWLEFWNNPTVKKIGRVKGNLYIRRPFVTVIGGVQPGLLKDFASGEKTENGFLARLLFVYPQRMERPPHSDQDPHESVRAAYRKIIRYIFDLPSKISHDDDDGSEGHTYSVDSIDLPITSAARKLYVTYRNENIVDYNRTDADSEKGLLGKSEMYALRFALILEILGRACNPEKGIPDVSNWTIGAETMKQAIILNNYFKDMSFKVLNSVDDVLSGLSDKEKSLYSALPDEFTTKECVVSAAALDWSEKSAKRFLNKHQFFKKLNRGLYSKRYA